MTVILGLLGPGFTLMSCTSLISGWKTSNELLDKVVGAADRLTLAVMVIFVNSTILLRRSARSRSIQNLHFQCSFDLVCAPTVV